ncbi:MAG: hypothetical protein Q8912_08640 [Bacillota bacterium]|nr:hypothetical protein [Bacillota bacterium]MDP4159698.1 hypothetical protein [Bacillota bacterium]
MSHSFFSRSRSKGHYPNWNHGSGYYKKSHGSEGILGKIFEALTGSKRHSHSHSDHNYGHHKKHHYRKSSWS